MTNALKRKLIAAGLIGLSFFAIIPSDFVGRLCSGAIAGSLFYLIVFLFDESEM
jgi:hypothetical protein